MSEPIKPSPDRLQKWLRRLHAPDEVLRVHAAMRLTAPEVDASDALPALRQALADPDPGVRQLAGWVLARMPAGCRAA